MSVWVIGAGTMSQDYSRVLSDLGQAHEVIGRGATSAAEFQQATGRAARTGGLAVALAESEPPTSAIVAVGVDALAGATKALMAAGTKRVLVEKPAGLTTDELDSVRDEAARYGARVLLGYNRRFFASVAAARAMIDADGGAVSCVYEFTEWGHVIGPLTTAAAIKARWFLANSTHVVDLAFHLCGVPSDWRAWHAGTLDWHPSAARFTGAGVTDRGVLFSYHADWEASGRWGLEVLTRKRRLILRPMEQLQVTPLGSVKVEGVAIDDDADRTFRPGVYKQTAAFLAGDDALFCDIETQARHGRLYDQMAGYPSLGGVEGQDVG
jgi:predicted dehydrogenase